MIKYKRVYFFGGDKRKDDDMYEDYVTAYLASNGARIDLHWHTQTQKWYEVSGKMFDTLKEAKEYIAASKNV